MRRVPPSVEFGASWIDWHTTIWPSLERMSSLPPEAVIKHDDIITASIKEAEHGFCSDGSDVGHI